jgi:hypothetical protein
VEKGQAEKVEEGMEAAETVVAGRAEEGKVAGSGEGVEEAGRGVAEKAVEQEEVTEEETVVEMEEVTEEAVAVAEVVGMVAEEMVEAGMEPEESHAQSIPRRRCNEGAPRPDRSR